MQALARSHDTLHDGPCMAVQVLGMPMIPCMMMVLGSVLHKGPGSANVPPRLIAGVSAFRLVIIPLSGKLRRIPYLLQVSRYPGICPAFRQTDHPCSIGCTCCKVCADCRLEKCTLKGYCQMQPLSCSASGGQGVTSCLQALYSCVSGLWQLTVSFSMLQDGCEASTNLWPLGCR